MTPKEEYEIRKSERDRLVNAGKVDVQSAREHDYIDRFLTAFERLADAADRFTGRAS